MTPKVLIQSLLEKTYETEDGDSFSIELLDGMSPEELDDYKSQFPSKTLPAEMTELLSFCRGFVFELLDEVRFDEFGQFGFEEAFPNALPLAGDGAGNFWVVDIDSAGNWNSVYFLCHDPAVIVKQAEDLTEFLKQVDEFGEDMANSALALMQEAMVFEVWNNPNKELEVDASESDFNAGSLALPESYFVADLTGRPNRSGFAWGRTSSGAKVMRPGDAPLWIVEKIVTKVPEKKKGFFARLFGG